MSFEVVDHCGMYVQSFTDGQSLRTLVKTKTKSRGGDQVTRKRTSIQHGQEWIVRRE